MGSLLLFLAAMVVAWPVVFFAYGGAGTLVVLGLIGAPLAAIHALLRGWPPHDVLRDGLRLVVGSAGVFALTGALGVTLGPWPGLETFGGWAAGAARGTAAGAILMAVVLPFSDPE